LVPTWQGQAQPVAPTFTGRKADVVKLIEQAVTDGAAVIKQQGDAGLDKTTPFAWETGKHVVHNSYIWITAIEHSHRTLRPTGRLLPREQLGAAGIAAVMRQ